MQIARWHWLHTVQPNRPTLTLQLSYDLRGYKKTSLVWCQHCLFRPIQNTGIM